MKAEAVIAALRRHYPEQAWALIEQVGNGTGWAANRHADAVVMGLWPSRGLEIHGIEVKVSRQDWKRELEKPDKAEPIAERCDRWFIAAPKGLIDLWSLPPAWGLLEIEGEGDKTRVLTSKPADKLTPKPLDRMFVAAILRRVAVLPSPTYPDGASGTRGSTREERRDHRLRGRTSAPSTPIEDGCPARAGGGVRD